MRDNAEINSSLDRHESELRNHEARLLDMEEWKTTIAEVLRETNTRLHEVATAISGNPSMGIKGIVSAVEEVGKKHDHLSSSFESLSKNVAKIFFGFGGAIFILVAVWEVVKFYTEYFKK